MVSGTEGRIVDDRKPKFNSLIRRACGLSEPSSWVHGPKSSSTCGRFLTAKKARGRLGLRHERSCSEGHAPKVPLASGHVCCGDLGLCSPGLGLACPCFLLPKMTFAPILYQ